MVCVDPPYSDRCPQRVRRRFCEAPGGSFGRERDRGPITPGPSAQGLVEHGPSSCELELDQADLTGPMRDQVKVVAPVRIRIDPVALLFQVPADHRAACRARSGSRAAVDPAASRTAAKEPPVDPGAREVEEDRPAVRAGVDRVRALVERVEDPAELLGAYKVARTDRRVAGNGGRDTVGEAVGRRGPSSGGELIQELGKPARERPLPPIGGNAPNAEGRPAERLHIETRIAHRLRVRLERGLLGGTELYRDRLHQRLAPQPPLSLERVEDQTFARGVLVDEHEAVGSYCDPVQPVERAQELETGVAGSFPEEKRGRWLEEATLDSGEEPCLGYHRQGGPGATVRARGRRCDPSPRGAAATERGLSPRRGAPPRERPRRARIP